MRLYEKPVLHLAPFDVEDVITVSVNIGGIDDEGVQVDLAGAPIFDDAILANSPFPESTVENPSGAFRQQVTGGNIIQEGLNNLYENFLNKF